MSARDRDYTDSESETEAALLGETREHSPLPPSPSPSARARSPSKLRDEPEGEETVEGASSRKTALRQNLTHLSDTPHGSMSPADRGRDRSSLSPPPPIKLKLGGGAGTKHARSSAMYSDSDDDSEVVALGDKGTAPVTAASTAASTPKVRSPPPKKQKTSKARTTSVTSNTGPAGPSVPATGRKAYNWLTPSAAGASHRGPPDRGERHSSIGMSRNTSLAGDDDHHAKDSKDRDLHKDKDKAIADDRDTGRDSAPPSEKKKAAPRRKPAAAAATAAAAGEPAPKNWRKGLKKGDAFLDGARTGRSSPLATPSHPSVSRDTSPEPLDAMLLEAATPAKSTPAPAPKREREREREEKPIAPAPIPAHHYHRETTPPSFVLADAKVMGIPVFANPITTPKLVLGTFPKVTSFFAPFDNKPFRKENPRDWSFSERSIAGIGGGSLKFKTWRPGPPSELGRVHAAMKEAEALAKQRKKESRESERLERGLGEATPERPSLSHRDSADSVLPEQALAQTPEPGTSTAGGAGDDASEAGDDSEASGMLSPTPRRGAHAKRGRPRKSKLANEIIPIDIDDDGPGTASARPSAEPEGKPIAA